VGGNDSRVIVGQKFPSEKESVRWCVVVMQQPVLLSPKFWAKSSHIFTQLPSNVTVEYGIDCSACHGEFFVKNPLDVKENYEHAIDFALRLSCRFRSGLTRACHSNTSIRLMLSSPKVYLIIARISVRLFSDLHKIKIKIAYPSNIYCHSSFQDSALSSSSDTLAPQSLRSSVILLLNEIG
jgi:hypothetical protein